MPIAKAKYRTWGQALQRTAFGLKEDPEASFEYLKQGGNHMLDGMLWQGKGVGGLGLCITCQQRSDNRKARPNIGIQIVQHSIRDQAAGQTVRRGAG